MNDLTKVKNVLQESEIDIIKNTICKGATDEELKLFVHTCQRTGLDPLSRQVFAVKRWDSKLGREVMGIQTSIDGFRLIAERSGKYQGQDGPYWCDEDGVWVDVWLKKTPPLAAKVGVRRSDFMEPIYSVARFDTYAQRKKDGTLNSMWAKMPDLMIAKCSESQALRRAFPHEMSGLFTVEELPQSSHIDYKKEETKPVYIEPVFAEDYITRPQQKRLFAIAMENEVEKEHLQDFLFREYDLESTSEIKKDQYEEICEKVMHL